MYLVNIRFSKEWSDVLDAAKSERPYIGHRLNELIAEVLNYDIVKKVPIVHEHLAQMLPYTMVGGKMARGAAVVTSVRKIRHQPLTEKELNEVRTLGAAIEVLQAHFLVADDIMDGSVTRRGQLCWYQAGGNGLDAINDANILNAIVYAILNDHFASHPCGSYISRLFQYINLITDLGQAADILTSRQANNGIQWEKYNSNSHNDIVKYKTSYYTTVLPVRAALYYCNIIDPKTHKEAEDILLRIGHLFQSQDDFLDYYMDPESLGKIGTDIQDGKCSWVIVTALSLASKEQTAILKANYGKKDPKAEAIVKSIYNDLNIPRVFAKFEETKYDEIIQLVNNWDEKSTQIPRSLFLSVFAPLYKRLK